MHDKSNIYPELKILSPLEQTWASYRRNPLAMAAGIAALVYLFCTLATKRDDLGAWPPVVLVPPVSTGAALPAVDTATATGAQPEVPAEPSC